MKIEELINKNYSAFSEGEKELAKFMLSHKEDIYDLSINEFASQSLSSKSSVLRFAQKLGFTGYTEMKNLMKWESHLSEGHMSQVDFGEIVIQNVKRTISHLNNINLSKVCELMEQGANIYLMGTGLLQQNLALEMQRMFLGIGENMQIIPMDINTEIYQLVTERMSEDDLLIIFSRSGNNPTLKDALSIPLIKNVKILAITASENNWLTNHSTFFIPVYVDQHSKLISDWFYSSSAFHSIVETLAYHYFEYKNRSLTDK
ncbi:MurR/RpiR family transcriptional regulator [Gracilibacillus sp. HCP3S3_G5_1]|uniref:MurR/RpiR family transcriptional regulator n=1 Tax=unclassified Gracilibacillus TaxID=2625209 RepID=UPI003F89A601